MDISSILNQDPSAGPKVRSRGSQDCLSDKPRSLNKPSNCAGSSTPPYSMKSSPSTSPEAAAMDKSLSLTSAASSVPLSEYSTTTSQQNRYQRHPSFSSDKSSNYRSEDEQDDEKEEDEWEVEDDDEEEDEEEEGEESANLKRSDSNSSEGIGLGSRRLQNGRVMHSCHNCPKEFARRSDLGRHVKIHTGDRPNGCDICGKRFIQRSALTVHMRVHTGEKPHECQVCNKRFSDSSSLARHRRIHTGDRPYVCEHPGCSRAFTRRNTLNKHLKLHPGWSQRTNAQPRPTRLEHCKSSPVEPSTQMNTSTPRRNSFPDKPYSSLTRAMPRQRSFTQAIPPPASQQQQQEHRMPMAPTMAAYSYKPKTSHYYGLYRGQVSSVPLSPTHHAYHVENQYYAHAYPMFSTGSAPAPATVQPPPPPPQNYHLQPMASMHLPQHHSRVSLPARSDYQPQPQPQSSIHAAPRTIPEHEYSSKLREEQSKQLGQKPVMSKKSDAQAPRCDTVKLPSASSLIMSADLANKSAPSQEGHSRIEALVQAATVSNS